MENSNQRIKLVALLGSSSCRLPEAVEPLGKDLSVRFGGCFISMGQGFWSSRGNDFTDNFPATTVTGEGCLRIELLVLPDDIVKARSYLTDRCRYYNQSLELGCNYLHVEQQKATAHHVAID